MVRPPIHDLQAFLAVAHERSFTRAAARLGLSPSALSHAMRGLEARLGVRLLSRSTRSVAPTAAGERLIRAIAPSFEQIQTALQELGDLRDKPAGMIRITATEYAAETILLPKLATFLPHYPDIQVEITIDYGLTDIVAERYDAGVRSGEQVARDMIAVRIGPDLRMAIVGSPDYFAQRPLPRRPQDLTAHNCINLRLPSRGGLYAWELEKGRRKLNVHVDGQLVLNSATQMVQAALAGCGLACAPEGLVQPHVAQGRLLRVLDDWFPPYSGYHLYYASRRQTSLAFQRLVEALRYRG